MADAETLPTLAAGAVAALDALGRHAVGADRLHGGTISAVLRLHLDDGSTVVLKQRRSVPTEQWLAEADGLDGLRAGFARVPRVLSVGEGYILLEDFPHPVPDDDAFWAQFGRELAAMHLVTNDRHGWHRDNILGGVAQPNPWSDDGFDFFAQQRMLRYLDLDTVAGAFEPQDCAALEHVAGRLRDLVPAQPASLTHGDLWRPNVVAGGPLEPALCDPAVSYAWAEVDISMLLCSGGVPEACFAAYEEVRPLDEGWRERAPLLHVRELLSVIAHVGYDENTMRSIRETLAAFA